MMCIYRETIVPKDEPEKTNLSDYMSTNEMIQYLIDYGTVNGIQDIVAIAQALGDRLNAEFHG